MSMVAFQLFVVLSLVAGLHGHGMLMDPPNRSSLWRFDQSSPINYDDNQLFCGGRSVQWDINNGRCGVCGDDFRIPQPRPNENGGVYGEGKISKVYSKGQDIEVSVLITANHLGWFKFSICDLGNGKGYESEECFRDLKLTSGEDIYKVPSSDTGYYKTNLKLPDDLVCSRCVLRWHYNTGNSWGWCSDGSGALGCGPQENFRSCSDIAIV